MEECDITYKENQYFVIVLSVVTNTDSEICSLYQVHTLHMYSVQCC